MRREPPFFVKTAGLPNDSVPVLRHHDRVALLRNGARLARAVSDSALPALRNVVESSEGPVLVYDHGWIASDFYDGSLIYDFTRRRMHVVDLDSYRDAPFTEIDRLVGGGARTRNASELPSRRAARSAACNRLRCAWHADHRRSRRS